MLMSKGTSDHLEAFWYSEKSAGFGVKRSWVDIVVLNNLCDLGQVTCLMVSVSSFVDGREWV